MFADLNQQARTNFGQAAQSARMTPERSFWNRASESGARLLTGQVAVAQRGEVMPAAIGLGTAAIAHPALAGTIAFGAARMAAAMGLGAVGVPALATLAALYPDLLVVRAVGAGVRKMTEMGRQIRHLEFGGGNYNDSDAARALRMQAVYEMSGSTGAARRFLGQEARFLHQ